MGTPRVSQFAGTIIQPFCLLEQESNLEGEISKLGQEKVRQALRLSEMGLKRTLERLLADRLDFERFQVLLFH